MIGEYYLSWGESSFWVGESFMGLANIIRVSDLHLLPLFYYLKRSLSFRFRFRTHRLRLVRKSRIAGSESCTSSLGKIRSIILIIRKLLYHN
jgi:hypothetical protein